MKNLEILYECKDRRQHAFHANQNLIRYVRALVAFVTALMPMLAIGSDGFGTKVGEFNGVSAYSNGATDYFSNVINSANGYVTGYKWQCVEFATRYYWQVYGKKIEGGDAKTWYSNGKGLTRVQNGTTEAPTVGSILCSASGSAGHVAIIREVGPNFIKVIQQNWSNDSADNAYQFSMTVSSGHFTINSTTHYAWQGWLKPPTNNLPPLVSLGATPPSGRWYRTNQHLDWAVTQGTGTVEVVEWGPTGRIGGPYTTSTGYVNIANSVGVWGDYFVTASNGVPPDAQSSHWTGGFDETGPTAALTGGAVPGVWLRGAQITTYTGYDAHSGFKDSQFGFGSPETGNWSPANPRVVSLPTDSGKYTLFAGIADDAWTDANNHVGNYSVVNLGTFWIDNTAPTVAIANIAPQSPSSAEVVAIAVSGTDAHSGIDRIEVRVNGSLLGSVQNGGVVNWTTSGFPYANSIEVKSIDNAGNENTVSQNYLVDSSPPSTPIVADEGPETPSCQTLAFAVESSDLQSGISSLEYKLGTTPGGAEIRGPVSFVYEGQSLAVGNLVLPAGQIVYMSVRAKNGVGTWSDWGMSDGIKFNPDSFGTILQRFVLASGTESSNDLYRLSGTFAEPIAFGDISGFWAGSGETGLSGSVTLLDYFASPAGQLVTVDLVQGGVLLEHLTATLDDSGTYSCSTHVSGPTQIYVRGSRWLRRFVGTVDIQSGIASVPDVSLINGDCNGDNYIGTDDYLILSASFDLSFGDVGFDPRADLSGDGYVGTDDYLIINDAFDTYGD